MATLNDSTNLSGTITLSKATGTKVTLDTDKKYITKDIELTINAPTTTATANGLTVSYGSGWINSGSTTCSDANLVAGNIKKDTTIFGITGTYTSDANATADDILLNKTAYVNGVKLTGTIPDGDSLAYGNSVGAQYVNIAQVGTATVG